MNNKILVITMTAMLAFVSLAGCSRSGGESAEKSSMDEKAPVNNDVQTVSMDSKRLADEGIKCFERNNYDCAAEKFRAALEIDETSEVYNYLGMACRFKYNETALGEWKDKEIEAFKKALELNDKNVIATKNLAATYYYIGEKKKAAELLERALELNPYDPEKEQIEKMIEEGR